MGCQRRRQDLPGKGSGGTQGPSQDRQTLLLPLSELLPVGHGPAPGQGVEEDLGVGFPEAIPRLPSLVEEPVHFPDLRNQVPTLATEPPSRPFPVHPGRLGPVHRLQHGPAGGREDAAPPGPQEPAGLPVTRSFRPLVRKTHGDIHKHEFGPSPPAGPEGGHVRVEGSRPPFHGAGVGWAGTLRGTLRRGTRRAGVAAGEPHREPSPPASVHPHPPPPLHPVVPRAPAARVPGRGALRNEARAAGVVNLP